MILRLVILATAMVGCVPNTDNLQLGSGDVSVSATKPGGYERSEHWPVASAWAQPYYSYPIDPVGGGIDFSHGEGGFDITFSGDTTSPSPPTCRDRELLTQNPSHLSLQTTRKGTPSLATGDVPFVKGEDLGALVTTMSTYAEFDTLAIDAGHVTITAVDDEHITGTFEGSGMDDWSEHVVGYFDVPICWN